MMMGSNPTHPKRVKGAVGGMAPSTGTAPFDHKSAWGSWLQYTRSQTTAQHNHTHTVGMEQPCATMLGVTPSEDKIEPTSPLP